MQKASNEFYSRHARRYSQVTHEFIQSVYSNVSHPGLTGDMAVIERMRELIQPQSRGLDAGCGAGARDVFFYWQSGYDVWGFDAVEENILMAKEMHPEISERVSVEDLSKPLMYQDSHFDFLLCNAVIQHISPELVSEITLPELARILKPGGVLQLMFKVGQGVKEVYDKDYDSHREFQLYEAEKIIAILSKLGLEVIPAEGDKLGGVMYLTDTKPVEHCLVFARKLYSN